MANSNEVKLIYCSSLTFPSGLANRLQAVAMAKAFSQKLGKNFYFGVSKIGLGSESYLGGLKETNILEFGTTKSYWLALRYLNFIKKNKIQYVYSREPRLLLFLIFWKKLLFLSKLKFIYEVHLILKRSSLDEIVDKILSRQADYFIFITKSLQNLYSEKYKCPLKKSMVAPDGVDLEIFDLDLTTQEARKKLNLPLDKKIIGFFGRFRTMGQDKGLQTILEALKFLEEDVLLLAMGGKPRDIKYYSDQAKLSGVSDKVLFVEHFNQNEVAIRQKACDILLMPFPYTQHFAYYMSPLKMFEYMASKRPIIASDLPSLREVLNEKNAFFVKPDNPEDLAKTIQRVLENQELSNKISEKSFQDVQKYTWQKRVERILAFIR